MIYMYICDLYTELKYYCQSTAIIPIPLSQTGNNDNYLFADTVKVFPIKI
jgi:hypothetical protein